MKARREMDSSTRSRRSRAASHEVIDAEWSELPAGTPAAPSGPSAEPAPPLEIHARAVPGDAGSPSLPRPLPLEILPRVGRCVACGQPGAPRLVILGVRAFPVCARCRLLASAASRIIR